MLKRLLILPLIAAATLAAPASSNAAADSNPTNWTLGGTQSGQIQTTWYANCNTAWNMTLAIQYLDANGWHNATCHNIVPCRRDKPSDGSWFTADSTHSSLDDWDVVVPANVCTHSFRIRENFHFFSG